MESSGTQPTAQLAGEAEAVVPVDKQVLGSLEDHGVSFNEFRASVAPAPGLYAVHGDSQAWERLGLATAGDGRPLYVGKAERSLAGRDVHTHFRSGRTGSSTLRRSLAALLRDPLDLRAQPRNPAPPGHFANYGLEPAGDERLTAWMCEHLRLATWTASVDLFLGDLETAVLAALQPPLNIDKVRTPWRAQVRAARKRMSEEARCWVGSAD